MSQDMIETMLAAIRESIAQIQDSAGADRSRTLTRALAHLWSAHDELELSGHEAVAAR